MLFWQNCQRTDSQSLKFHFITVDFWPKILLFKTQKACWQEVNIQQGTMITTKFFFRAIQKSDTSLFFLLENLNIWRFVYIFLNLTFILTTAKTESSQIDTLKRMNKIGGVLFVGYYSCDSTASSGYLNSELSLLSLIFM